MMTERTEIEAAQVAAPVTPTSGVFAPLPLNDVRITGGYWGERQSVNATGTLPHCVEWITRMGWVDNFDRAARGEGGHQGREFSDSEVFKVIEALAWESARSGDEWVEGTYRRLTSVVIAAQQADGYLNTMFGGPGQAPRYSDLEWGHELYCAGHVIQAAVARLRTAGPDLFTETAMRIADHILNVFGPNGRAAVCGHPEIEVALAELGRVTGRRRYLQQARLFIERRGHGLLDAQEFGSEYFQDDVPVRDSQVLRGHAVRALYFSAAAFDVAVEFDDRGLREALVQQWTRTVARRTYVTGGMGSRHEGESFGDDFELPSDRAYSETCAGVGSIMFSWRLLLGEGDERYADLIERTLYNVIATSPDAQGTSFFYVNPLQRNVPGTAPDTDRASVRASSSLRAPWFEVSCCPPNVARTIASLSAYIATRSSEGLQVHQFVPADIDTTLPDGEEVHLRMSTAYPADGRVTLEVLADATREWTISLRIPSWAPGSRVTLNGQDVAVDGPAVNVSRRFTAGDVVELLLPIAPRLTRPDHRIDALRGTVAVERGPLVLCAESVDLPHDVELMNVVVAGAPEPDGEGARMDAGATTVREDANLPYWPYLEHGAPSPVAPFALRLTPYNGWAGRGPSTMRVWLPARTTGDGVRA